MICLIFFLALSRISSAAVNTPGGLTSIEWTSATSSDEIPNLAINFRDGRQYEAVLRRMDLFSPELGSTGLSSDHLCIFEGSLKNDLDSRILLTGGCPGENTFELTTSGNALGSLKLKVVDGVVKEISSFNNEFQGRDKDDTNVTTNAQWRAETRGSLPLPAAGFVLKLGIIYDKAWLQIYGTHQESINAATRVVAKGQEYFNMPSLTVRVKLQIASIAHKDVQLDSGNKGLDIMKQFSTDSTINIYVGMTTNDKGGMADADGIICGNVSHRRAVIGKNYCFTFNSDLTGNDISKSTSIDSPYMCQQLCQINSNCKFFTYNPSIKTCYLKSASNPTPSPGAVSGPKKCDCFEPDYDFSGNDIFNKINIDGQNTCQKLCQDNSNCKFFTYNTFSKTCYLKSAASKLTPYAGAVSGPKNCRSAEEEAAENLGHELGHCIGAPHDFISDKPIVIRRDSTGKICTGNNYIMDYYKVGVSGWSTCSVEAITAYYNRIIAQQGQFCLTPDNCFKIDQDSYGFDIGNSKSTSALECQKLCLDNSACNFFTFNSLTQTCYLKRDKASNLGSYKGAVSGPKICPP